MRKYEAVCVFRTDENHFATGQEAVKAHLADLGATFVKEEDMGQRALAYPIKKHVQAHYYVYYVQMDPQKAHQVEDKVRHQEELLRFLMVRRDEDEKVTPEKAEKPEKPAATETAQSTVEAVSTEETESTEEAVSTEETESTEDTPETTEDS